VGGNRVTGGARYTVAVWDGLGGKRLGSFPGGHVARISALAWSGDGRRLVTTSYDRTLRVWDVSTLGTTGAKGVLTLTGHQGDLPVLAGGKDDNIRYEQNWIGYSQYQNSQLQVRALAWSADGKLLATGSQFKVHDERGTVTLSGRVRVWDPATGTTLKALDGPGPVWAVAWSGSGRRLAALFGASQERQQKRWEIKVWETAAWREVASVAIDGRADAGGGQAAEPAVFLASSPDGRWLAVDGGAGVTVRDVEGNTAFTLGSEATGPLAWRPDGKGLATLGKAGGENAACIWDAQTGKLARAVKGGSGAAFQALLWSPDGKRLFTGDRDNNIAVWDPETGTELLTLKGPSASLAWSTDGRLLSQGDGGPRIWAASGPGK
jgi:WD40 repeat protein